MAAPGSDQTASEPMLARYRRMLRRRSLIMAALGLLIIAALVTDLLTGPSGLAWHDIGRTLLHPGQATATTRAIVWDIRLPAACMALAIGLALGQAGAEMQTLLNNPLASPFTLGVSSAAALGASLVIVLGWMPLHLPQSALVAGCAFAFALAATLLLEAMARWGGMNASGLILFGIALVFSLNAAISLVQYVASAEALQGLVFWTMGSLASASWGKAGLLLLACAVALPLALRDTWKLTALRFGEDRAASLGIDVRALRRAALLRVSLLAALAVAFAGTIGFVGLIAPHMARRIFGEDHRYYLPGSTLLGALMLSIASTVSKNAVPGIIIPIGIVTSLIGVPFFIAIILRHHEP